VPLLGFGFFQHDDLRLGQTRLVGNADLTEGRLLDRQRYDGVLYLLWHAVLQHRLLAADFLQRQFAALVVGRFEPVEAVAAANYCVPRSGSAPWFMGSKKSLGIFEKHRKLILEQLRRLSA